MPNWSHQLPPRDRPFGCDLRRVPTASALKGIVTCETITVCDTHYWHGRTQPCERQTNDQGRTIDDTQCPACIAKQPWRAHAYVSIFDPRAKEHYILELTTAAAQPLEDYYKEYGNLKGCQINAWRTKDKPNSKVNLMTAPANLTQIRIPPPPNLIEALCVIWRVPRKAARTEPQYNGTDATDWDPDQIGQMQTQEPNAGDPTAFEQRRDQVLAELAAAQKPNGKPRKQKATA